MESNHFGALQVEGSQNKEPCVIVESEDQPDRLLLQTKICKEDGFQKQQGMLRNEINITEGKMLTVIDRDLDCVDRAY